MTLFYIFFLRKDKTKKKEEKKGKITNTLASRRGEGGRGGGGGGTGPHLRLRVHHGGRHRGDRGVSETRHQRVEVGGL